MRISDWSSDVCSSDLRDRRRRQAGQGNGSSDGLLFVRGRGAGGGRIALGRDDVGGPAKAAMPEPGFREAIVAMRFDERADCIEVAALRGGREGERNRPETEVEQSGAERRLAVIVALRSEEHTSELLSLLRISYAVF